MIWDRFIKTFSGGLFRLLGFFFPPIAGSLPLEPRLILVFSTTGIGDALFDTAAIRSLKAAYPQTRIIVCAHRKRQTIARHHPDVEEVVPYGKSPLIFWRLIWRFRRERPDLVLLLQINEEVVPIAYCINRRALVGGVEKSGRFAHLLSHPLIIPPEEHLLRYPMAIAQAVGGKAGIPLMSYHSTVEERDSLVTRFAPWISQPFLVFQTGGGKTLSWRDWPAESYIRIITWVQQVSNLTIVLTGGWDNELTAHTIGKACPDVINLCCKTTLEETAAILHFAVMLISTDTGVMHLGFAVGCPTLALLHYKNPATMVGPLDNSAGHEVIELTAPVDFKTSSVAAMQGIPDEAVRDAIVRMLLKKGIFLENLALLP